MVLDFLGVSRDLRMEQGVSEINVILRVKQLFHDISDYTQIYQTKNVEPILPLR